MNIEKLSESKGWPKNLIGLSAIWRGMDEGVINSAEDRRAGGPIVSMLIGEAEIFGLTIGEWDLKSDCEYKNGEWELK